MACRETPLYELRAQSLCPVPKHCVPCTDLRHHLNGTGAFTVRLKSSSLAHAVMRINHRNQNASKTGHLFYYYFKAGDTKKNLIHVHAQAAKLQVPLYAAGPYVLLRSLESYDAEKGNMAGLCALVAIQKGRPLAECPGTQPLHGWSTAFYFPQLNGVVNKPGKRLVRQSFSVGADSGLLLRQVGAGSVVEVCGNPHICAAMAACQYLLRSNAQAWASMEKARGALWEVPPGLFFEWVFGSEQACIQSVVTYFETTECVPADVQELLGQSQTQLFLCQALAVLGKHVAHRGALDSIYDYLWLYAWQHRADTCRHDRNFHSSKNLLPSCASMGRERGNSHGDAAGDGGSGMVGGRKRKLDEISQDQTTANYYSRLYKIPRGFASISIPARTNRTSVEEGAERPNMPIGAQYGQPMESPVYPLIHDQIYTPASRSPTPPCSLPRNEPKLHEPPVKSDWKSSITNDVIPNVPPHTIPIEEHLIEIYDKESKWAAAETDKLTSVLSELEREMGLLHAADIEPPLLLQWAEGAVCRLGGVAMGLPVVLLALAAVRAHRAPAASSQAPLWLRTQFHHSRTVTDVGEAMLGPLARLFLAPEGPSAVADLCMRQLAGGSMDTLYRRLYAIEPPHSQIAVALPKIVLDLPEISDVLWAANIPVVECSHPTIQLLSSDHPLIEISLAFGQAPPLPPTPTPNIQRVSVCISEATVRSHWLASCANLGIYPIHVVGLGSFANFLVLLARHFQHSGHEPPMPRGPRGPIEILSVGQMAAQLATCPPEGGFGRGGPLVVVGGGPEEGRMDHIACLYIQARLLTRGWWPVLCCGPEAVEGCVVAAEAICKHLEYTGNT